MPDNLCARSFVRVALPASLSSQSIPFTPACPGLYTQRSLRRWMSTIDIFESGLPIPLRVTSFRKPGVNSHRHSSVGRLPFVVVAVVVCLFVNKRSNIY